jgi:hypothetical protein
MRAVAKALPAALLVVSQLVHSETQYYSSLGPNGGAPYVRTRAQLEAMGGTWNADRFTTHASFHNTNDPVAATFAVRVTYTPLRNSPKKPTPGR